MPAAYPVISPVHPVIGGKPGGGSQFLISGFLGGQLGLLLFLFLFELLLFLFASLVFILLTAFFSHHETPLVVFWRSRLRASHNFIIAHLRLMMSSEKRPEFGPKANSG